MNINMRSGGKVTIYGRTFSGRDVVIQNGKVVVDGKTQDGELVGDVSVVVHGDVEILENAGGSVTAQNIGSINTGSGDVRCGNVSGAIRTGSGDVQCDNVSGSIRTGSGDVYHNTK